MRPTVSPEHSCSPLPQSAPGTCGGTGRRFTLSPAPRRAVPRWSLLRAAALLPIAAACALGCEAQDPAFVPPPRNRAAAAAGRCPPAPTGAPALAVRHGWLVFGDRVIWGYAQHNGWWRAGQRPNLTRNDPARVGPNRTEDLAALSDNMVRYGYPGFEHCYGLWYDRRRDRHDTARRTSVAARPPFLEQPWARSGRGTAWDGLSKYDLESFNPWYFERLREFARCCRRKEAVLIYDCYMQHPLLERQTHYVDFPWRPANCIQETGLPDAVPAANAFYDVSRPILRKLHRLYLRHSLDVLGASGSTVFLLGCEFTGPAAFVEFWLDVIGEWEVEHAADVLVGLGATKDVLDRFAGDPRVELLDLRYWWYRPDGSLHAPPGGREVPGRYALGTGAAKTTAAQIYRQVRETRDRYPEKAIIHQIEASLEQSVAFLMGGGSLLIRYLEHPGGADPESYIPPADTAQVLPLYRFIGRRLGERLARMRPDDSICAAPRGWCLADPGRTYLVRPLGVAGEGSAELELNLSAARARYLALWFDAESGLARAAAGGAIEGGAKVAVRLPGPGVWLLLLERTADPASPGGGGGGRSDDGRGADGSGSGGRGGGS